MNAKPTYDELVAALRNLTDAARNGLPGRERACHPARTLAYRNARDLLRRLQPEKIGRD